MKHEAFLKHCLSNYSDSDGGKSVKWFFDGLIFDKGVEILLKTMDQKIPRMWKEKTDMDVVMQCYNYIKYQLEENKDSEDIYLSKGNKYNKIDNKIVQIGGNPEWIQSNERPHCCNAMMSFVGSIGSRLKRDGWKTETIYGDMGVIYTFICDKCKEGKVVFQQH